LKKAKSYVINGKIERTFGLDTMKILCAIINSSDYLSNIALDLDTKTKDQIDSRYKEKINFTDVDVEFGSVVSETMKILMEGTVEFFRPHFIEISKINWSECEDVVDDSPYIIAIGEDINTTFPHIHQYLVESKFNLYRDSFSQLMIKEF